MALLTPKAADIIPDWKQLWTIEEAEREIDFKHGIERNKIDGWHLLKHDTLLVIPSEHEGKYWFWVYNDRNPCDDFNAITNAPVRADERE